MDEQEFMLPVAQSSIPVQFGLFSRVNSEIRSLRQLASSSPEEQCGVKSHTLLSSIHSPSSHTNHKGGQAGGEDTLLPIRGPVNTTLVHLDEKAVFTGKTLFDSQELIKSYSCYHSY